MIERVLVFMKELAATLEQGLASGPRRIVQPVRITIPPVRRRAGR